MEKPLSASNHPILVGGLSALALSRLSHYIPLGPTPRIHLYSGQRLPTWLGKLPVRAEFERHLTGKIWPKDLNLETPIVLDHDWRDDLPSLRYSSPEKALIELMVGVPSNISFEHVDEIMQNATTLSPTKLDTLLRACVSIKAKRLFLWFAKRQNYAWFKKLNAINYDLGSGKRVVAKGGVLDKEFLITVPTHMSNFESLG